jgi:hypothetical protein
MSESIESGGFRGTENRSTDNRKWLQPHRLSVEAMDDTPQVQSRLLQALSAQTLKLKTGPENRRQVPKL